MSRMRHAYAGGGTSWVYQLWHWEWSELTWPSLAQSVVWVLQEALHSEGDLSLNKVRKVGKNTVQWPPDCIKAKKIPAIALSIICKSIFMALDLLNAFPIAEW